MLTIMRNGRSDSAILEDFFAFTGRTADDYGSLLFRPGSCSGFASLVELDSEPPAATHSMPDRRAVIVSERKLLYILG